MADYPDEILPKLNFRREINIDRLKNRYGDFFVCRRIDRPVADYIEDVMSDGTKILDIESCLGKHYIGLSMNLMGAVFEEKHLKYNCKGDASKKWNGRFVNIDDFIGMTEDLGSGFPLYFSSRSIHRRTFPHIHKNLKKVNVEAMKAKVKALCNMEFNKFPIDITQHYELFIRHVPTNLNYWHVQMEVKPDMELDETALKKSNAWIKDMFTHSVFDILEREFIEHPEIKVLSKNCVPCPLDCYCMTGGIQ